MSGLANRETQTERQNNDADTNHVTLDATYSLDDCDKRCAWPLSEIAVEMEVVYDMLVDDPSTFADGVFTDDGMDDAAALRQLYSSAVDEITTAYCHAKADRGTAVGAARRAVAITVVLCWFIDNGETHFDRLRDWEFSELRSESGNRNQNTTSSGEVDDSDD